MGTEFDVTAYPKSNQLKVRLYEGKVVVKATNKANTKMKNDVYLLPGQEFVYGGPTIAKVSSFDAAKDSIVGQSINNDLIVDRPSIPKDEQKNWYMFNNQSLEKVLDNLAALYNQKILYNKNDVKKIYFTGKYNKSDSLETILQRIAIINNLKIIKNDTAFMITK